jgi:lipid-binding SYLF domain-containing protein
MFYRNVKFALAATAVVLVGCGSTPNVGSTQDREFLHADSRASLVEFRAKDSSLESLLNKAHAYAIFPEVVAGAVLLGGAHGNGEVFKGGKLIGYTDVSQGSVGAQLGGQKFAELVVFQNESALVSFQQSTYEFDARASAVAAANGAAATADYSHGVIVFTMPEGGLMAQASLGVQKFRYVPVGP